jgi:hypothetical protein
MRGSVMPGTEHDRIAERIADKLGAPYNPSKGADIVSPEKVVEVEVDANGLSRGIEQLQGYKRLRYLGVPKRLVPAAMEKAEGTKIGVMDQNGNIVKRAQRPTTKKR